MLTSLMLSSVCRPATVSGGMLKGEFGRTVRSSGRGRLGPRSVAMTSASGANGGTSSPVWPGAFRNVLTMVAMFLGTVCSAGSVLRAMP